MQIEMTNKRWGILAVFVLVVVLAIYASWPPTMKPPDATAAITAAVEAAKKPLLAQIAEKEKEAKDYLSRLKVSEAKYTTLAQKYIKLQKEKIDVKPPTTNAELRARFTALGYPPLPVK